MDVLECTVVMNPSRMPNNVHGHVPAQGRDDDIGPVKEVSLGLGDREHVGRLTDVCVGAGQRPGDLGHVAHVEELNTDHDLSDQADGVTGVSGGVGGDDSRVLAVGQQCPAA